MGGSQHPIALDRTKRRRLLSSWKPTTWTGRRAHLGNSKEAFDAEVHAICRAIKGFDGRIEENRQYSVFSDSTVAIDRTATGGQGPGQATATKVIEVGQRLMHRGNMITVRCTPVHRGAECNEVADDWAKEAAEDTADAEDRLRLRVTSISHMTRAVAEAKTQGTKSWIENQVRRRRGYNPPKREQAPNEPQKRTEGPGQSILPGEARAPQSKALWKSVGKACREAPEDPSDKDALQRRLLQWCWPSYGTPRSARWFL